MIVIFCSSFEEAQEAFEMFVYLLESNEPWTIVEANPYTLMVMTDDDLQYVFIDYHLLDLFERLTPDILDVVRFFDGWEDYYEC